MTSLLAGGSSAGAAPSAGGRWVTAVLVSSLVASGCTSALPGTAGPSGGAPSASAQSPAGPGSIPPKSALLLPEASTEAERRIDREVSSALQARFATPGYRLLRSVLVLADGRTVLERYYPGGQSDYHGVWSVTKSVLSTLIGIAIAQGKVQGVDQTLEELLPAHADLQGEEHVLEQSQQCDDGG